MTQINEDDIALAAEYVLGLLDVAAAATVEARITVDAVFAKEVEAWRTRLQPMLVSDVEPSPHLWAAIETSLPATSGQDLGSEKLTFWRTLTGISVSAAAILGILLLQMPAAEPEISKPTPLIAALSSDDGAASLTASYDASTGRMVILPVSLDTGKLYPELWIIPADGQARSLGMVAQETPTTVSIPSDMRQYLASGVTLAITPEPESGAPGGKATGPVIASGKIAKL